MAEVRAKGAAGERAAGIDPKAPKERIPSATGTAKYRVIDASDSKSMTEVKNTGIFRITNQIKDFVSNAADTTRDFIVKLREGAFIGPKAQDYINENNIIVRPLTEVPPVEVKIEIPIIP